MSVLKVLIAEGEHHMQDFKFRVDNQQKIARTLVAFANTFGGRILIGVKDNGKIVGCVPEEEFYVVESAAEKFCKPPVKIQSFIWQEDLKLVLEIDVAPSEKRPHKAPDMDGNWKSFVRIEDNTLAGNKITEGVWRMQNYGVVRPEIFGMDDLEVLKVIRNGEPISLSKLYRSIPIAKRKIDRILIQLISWNLVVQEIGVSAIYYRTTEPEAHY
jgi:hypothetical protein